MKNDRILLAAIGVLLLSGCDAGGGSGARADSVRTSGDLMQRLSSAKGPVPVGEAVGISQVRFVCRKFDSSDVPQDSVEYLRMGFDPALPDSKIDWPSEKPFLYVVAADGESLIDLGPDHGAIDGPYGRGEVCVDAKTGVFAKADGLWILRTSADQIGPHESR